MQSFQTSVSRAEQQQSLFPHVFSWMFAGLSMTGIISFLLGTDDKLLNYFSENPMVYYGMLIGELVLVFFLAARVHKMAANTATFLFFAYAALNGVTITPLLLMYTQTSVTSTFFVTAGMFGAFALYGFKTKRDLSRLGSILFMALIGLILATLVNWFLANPVLYWIISYVGVLLFCGLTAYDIQKIKRINASRMDDETQTKVAVMGALALYLDFINLFIFLLRILGNRD